MEGLDDVKIELCFNKNNSNFMRRVDKHQNVLTDKFAYPAKSFGMHILRIEPLKVFPFHFT